MDADFRREIGKTLTDGVRTTNADIQRVVDRLAQTYKGKPMPQARTALSRELRQYGMSMTPFELTKYAQCLVSGEQRIMVKPGQLKIV